jgi:prevent-host-death family protein
MESVGVREIRQNLSVFLRRVTRGESFTVTDHGAPVALLTPLPSGSDDPLAGLVAVGRVIPANRRGGALPVAIAAHPGSPSVTESLVAERLTDQR